MTQIPFWHAMACLKEGSGALGDNPVIRNRQKGLKKKGASFFVSSPGAFVSSESRDARLYVSKCDRESVLQMQMPHGIPSMVCDISAGKVMVTNHECNELFESNELNGLLAHYEIFSLIHEEDRDRVSQTLAYLLVSGHMRMSPEEFTIVTMLGSTRRVRAEGSCLIGTWWQLDMCLIGEGGAAGCELRPGRPCVAARSEGWRRAAGRAAEAAPSEHYTSYFRELELYLSLSLFRSLSLSVSVRAATA
ncbi:unnamed protein product [Prorocentrum cordatum]|uniref:PAS domain-containing protein n=1 Tax=Prorocentrum cordatum TaxID=2364126 RepID=A0ABN9UDH5_9DINO|nr:unnamed protein product [Polarella glacialis]